MSKHRHFQVLFGIIVAVFLVMGESATPLRLSAQPPKKARVEEEEEPEPSKVPRKVEEIVPKSAANPDPRPVVPPAKFDFAREAARAKNLSVRTTLERLAVPYDLLIPVRGVPQRIALLPERQLPEGRLEYFELGPDLVKGTKREFPTATGFSLKPYEEWVLEEVEQLLNPANVKKFAGVGRGELEELAVQIIQVTRRRHATWVEQKVRVGKDWEQVDDRLRKRLVEIRREQLRVSVAAKDWPRADAIALELTPYADDPAAKRDIYRLLLRKALEKLTPDRDEDYVALREALSQFETLGGGEPDELTRTAKAALERRAAQFIEAAKKQAEQNQTAAAFGTLKNAELLAPDNPAIAAVRDRLRDRILYVGVPRLPERMTPATARDDAEKWAVELIFESLLQPIPDTETGRRFRPALASGLPDVAPLARDYELIRNARWSDGKPLDSRDVVGTLELLQKSPEHPGSAGAELIDAGRARVDDPLKVRLGFRQGLLEPLAQTNFKVLPARSLHDRNLSAESDAFARNPTGSGPYQFAGIEEEGNRPAAVYRPNPYYGQRPGKFGLPAIREIRFVVPDPSRAAADIADGRLHLVLDVAPADVPRYRDDPLSAGKMIAYKPHINRRVYMLAINHRRGVMQNVDLRRGLSAAIDREAILQDVFRPEGSKTGHLALAGPFPVNSWATPEKARRPENALFNKSLAGGLFAAAAGRERVRLSLLYPADDREAARACDRIKQQVETAARKTPNDPPAIEIQLEPLPIRQFESRVYDQHDFELAYLPYDYGDDTFALNPLFDPGAAGVGGRNFMGYLAPGTRPQADDHALKGEMDSLRLSRDFRDKVREGTWKLHGRFVSRMPFIPLWQLDRYVIAHRGLEMSVDGAKIDPSRLDPAVVFTGVEGWRLK